MYCTIAKLATWLATTLIGNRPAARLTNHPVRCYNASSFPNKNLNLN